jgi:cytoplasmic iron level regulating protein YaaA (DUF328/UPF0246 family)
MPKIVLISCVKTKLSYPAKAKNLYISSLFKKLYAYGKQLNPDAIFILSAKYGLLKSDDIIEPYELTLNNMPTKQVKAWSRNVIEKLGECTELQNDNFVFLAGDKYRRFLLPHIQHYEIPLKGLMIGQQLSWLKKRIEDGSM